MEPTIQVSQIQNPNSFEPSPECYSCTVDVRWTWKDRLRFKLFPKRHVEVPECSPQWKDVLHMKTHVHLSFLDRLRVLVTGHLIVKSMTVCQNVIGESKTASVAYPQL